MRTLSQGLQAFLPVAFALVWFRRAGAADTVTGLGWGTLAAVPVTAVATFAFRLTTSQALWEAALATAALPMALWFARQVRREPVVRAVSESSRRRTVCLAVAAGASLIIVRQAMEIAATLSVALQTREADPLLAIAGGAVMSLIASILWMRIGRRLTGPALRGATAIFAVLFTAQLAMYAIHEASEARLLPWSEALHAATEPYGPDGPFGRNVSLLLLLAPLGAAGILSGSTRRPLTTRRVAVTAAVLLAAGIGLVAMTKPEPVETPVPATPVPASAPAAEVNGGAAVPRLLFRHTGIDQNYSRLSSSPLDPVAPDARQATALSCERVSYAVGRGICLKAERGLFTAYKAIFLGPGFSAQSTIRLAGSPSRTRVSPDGRVGAITVFVTGQEHMYAGAAFSTRTTIVDMSTGDELGDLEQFSTWRNGARFKAADFNFWGVTFARDSNTFYATLGTAGTSYLVRGDLGLRKLTVLRENVECPSLSPDNRLIVFKKRVAKGAAPWRLYVLDVASLTERPLHSETRSIDDQIEWLDEGHVLYAAPRPAQPGRQDVWVAALDNAVAPRIFLHDADSPIVVR